MNLEFYCPFAQKKIENLLFSKNVVIGGFVTQRHNELRHLEAELLSTVCNDVGTKPVLQGILGGTFTCEIGHPYTWVLGAPTIGVLSCQSLSPKCRIV